MAPCKVDNLVDLFTTCPSSRIGKKGYLLIIAAAASEPEPNKRDSSNQQKITLEGIVVMHEWKL